MERVGFFHPALVEIVADLFALVADEVKTVDALVDLLAIEHATSEFLDADAEEFFVIFLYLAPPRFVTWQIFVF